MTKNNLSMYGTTVGFKKHSNVIEQAVLGQVTKWSMIPDSLFGIGLDKEFIESIARKSGSSLEQYIDFYQGRHTKVEFAPEDSELKEVRDGERGAKIMLQITGNFENPIEKKTLFRRRLKGFESNADLKARIRNAESDQFYEFPYNGKLVIGGPNYALVGFKKFFSENPCKAYQFRLVSTAQHMAFLSKY